MKNNQLKKLIIWRNGLLILALILAACTVFFGIKAFSATEKSDLGKLSGVFEDDPTPTETIAPSPTEDPDVLDNPNATEDSNEAGISSGSDESNTNDYASITLPDIMPDSTPEPTSPPNPTPTPEPKTASAHKPLFFISLVLLLIDLSAVIILTKKISTLKSEAEAVALNMAYEAVPNIEPIDMTKRMDTVSGKASPYPCTIGFVYNKGARPSQQDSLWIESTRGDNGVVAVVADGMGGLSNGEKVSGKIIEDVRYAAARVSTEQMNGFLPNLIDSINKDINVMLGPEGIYKSGSTIVIVMADQSCFSWASVGDSRIYLYRGGAINKINREHNVLTTEFMPQVNAGTMDLQNALQNPEGKKVTSFIGMGKLRYVEYCREPVDIVPGDRILLMSDGVFNTLNDAILADILKNCPDVEQAASEIEKQVLAANARGQDNFTAIILGF